MGFHSGWLLSCSLRCLFYTSDAAYRASGRFVAATMVQDAQNRTGELLDPYVFSDEADKNTAVAKALSEVMNRYPESEGRPDCEILDLGCCMPNGRQAKRSGNTWKVVADSGDKRIRIPGQVVPGGTHKVQARYWDGELVAVIGG